MHVYFVYRHVHCVFEVIFRKDFLKLLIILEKGLELKSPSIFDVSLVLENLAEAVELGFFPELAVCGGGYLYTEGSLSVLLPRYPSRLFSRSFAII